MWILILLERRSFVQMEGSGWMWSTEMEKADWEVSWKPTMEGSQAEKDLPYPHLLSPRNKLTKELLLLKSAAIVSRFSRVRLCGTPETAAHQAPPSRGFSRRDHRSGLPLPSSRQVYKSINGWTTNQHSSSKSLVFMSVKSSQWLTISYCKRHSYIADYLLNILTSFISCRGSVLFVQISSFPHKSQV